MQLLHYSFDLWMTIIKSNPQLKLERTAYFQKHYNRYEKTADEINHALRKVDILCNALNEKTGESISSENMYLMAIADINNGDTWMLKEIDLVRLYADMETLMLEYSPIPYCSQTERTLATLRERPNTTLGLLSNTGYTKGRTLRKILNRNGLGQYFDFQLYSDEANMAKPNPMFFETMISNARNCLPERPVELHQMIHIGDNEHADIAGAANAGISSLLVNSNNSCISTILSL